MLPQRYKFSSKSQRAGIAAVHGHVVVATAKVQIFKQITTPHPDHYQARRCCCYRKGTNFQANHNQLFFCALYFSLLLLPQRYKFSSKSQLTGRRRQLASSCCCYRKGTNFQANHNCCRGGDNIVIVVVATAKVQIFKQITTLLPVAIERYCCCCYRKGTNFQANHNGGRCENLGADVVVVATAKVQIFKQITTYLYYELFRILLLLLPQRYKFSSKSQPLARSISLEISCCCYRKGTNFQANHNLLDG